MTNKKVKYGNAFREQNLRATKKKQLFPKIYANRQEDYEMFESEEDQIDAIEVDKGRTADFN